MAWLPDGEKILNVLPFDRIYKRDEQIHELTPHDDIGRACHRAAKIVENSLDLVVVVNKFVIDFVQSSQ